MRLRELLLIGLLSLAPCLSRAEPFRCAAGSPILTLDPHTSTDPVTMMVLTNVYEALVGRDQNLGLVPGLAESWQTTSPTVWRFRLRPGVTFHDGQALSAADVTFSLDRASPGMFGQFLATVAEVTVVDDLTLDVRTKQPDPLLPRWLSAVQIMSRDWAMSHDAAKASLMTASADQYVVRHANGTGPYRLASWDSGTGRVQLLRNPAWWGAASGSVGEAEFSPIASGPTRVAALLSGQIDLLRDVPTSDIARIMASPGFKVAQRPSFRQMTLLMNPSTETAADTTDNDGRPLSSNPWRDVRVRQAVAHAIDSNLLVGRLMQGNAVPSSIASPRGLDGYQADLDVPYGFDPALSRRLLAEAGYPAGFHTVLQCTNDRYPNDEAVCRALSSMLSRIGITAAPNPRPWQNFVQDLTQLRLGFLLLGQLPNGQTTYDLLHSAYMTRHGQEGFLNWSLWSNPDFDQDLHALEAEFDPARRQALLHDALRIAREQVGSVMLYTETVSWAMKQGVDATPRQDSYVMLPWVRQN